MPVELSLAGKVALVTGASRAVGIGAAICRLLAQAGADIYFTYFTLYDQERPWGSQPEEVHQLYQDLLAMGARVASAEADLADPAMPAWLFDQAESVLGPVDILVNNATYDDESDLEHFSLPAFDQHIAVNVRGTTLMCVEFARRHNGRQGGRIINMVSGELVGPMPGNIPYVITKGAIDALTITFSGALAKKGITVNAIDPGATDTGWMPPDFKQWMIKNAPFGRVGQPEDAARLILFLASPLGGWITGQLLHSRGGA